MNLLHFMQFHCQMSEMKYRQVSLYAFSLQRHMKIYATLNLRNNFRFNVTWHRWFVAARFFCSRLAQSIITAISHMYVLNTLVI